MRWLFIISAEDSEDYRKQKKQWELVSASVPRETVCIDALSYKGAEPLDIAEDLIEINRGRKYEGILVAHGDRTDEIAGRYAALGGCRCLLGVCDITWEKDSPLFHKSVYQSNMEASFPIQPPFAAGLTSWKDRGYPVCTEMLPAERIIPRPLKATEEKILIEAGAKQKESDVLLAAGKGVRTKEDVQKLKELAADKGYMFGVTRPVAMNGWAPTDEIIGVSGHIYSPKVCITIGVSGSAAFYAGIENSGWIASVNTDEHAPIVKMSDIVVIDDYKNIWEKLSHIL